MSTGDAGHGGRHGKHQAGRPAGATQSCPAVVEEMVSGIDDIQVRERAARALEVAEGQVLSAEDSSEG